MDSMPKTPDAGEQTIFDAARQMPDAQERAAYLDAACAGDALLRERVEKLLKASLRADEFLAQYPIGPLTPALSPSDGERETGVEGPGTIIGNYKLLEKLGEGGFGVVYMAEQKQPIKRRVALKIIKVGMDTREVVARFEAERQALAVMDHPNIAKVFDAGATESPLPASGHPLPSSDEGRGQGEGSTSATRHSSLVTSAGRPYFVMELVRGIKITDYCDEKHLSARERLDLFTQVCQAVQHAHQKGIIHRDLKPSNILVTVNDGVAVPKIIDFGIAKATQMELTEKTVFTRFHQFLGTPAYMSPEQTEITSVDIDTRSDIYSLGVLLYELLTGKTPFDTNELLKAGLDEMRRTIREKEPLKPSTRLTQDLVAADVSPRKSNQGLAIPTQEEVSADSRQRLRLKEQIARVRGDLDWIVMKCLEKDRARRYETANGLASDIQRHLNNEPVVACPPSNLYKFQKLVRRNKLAFAAGAGIATALVIGLAIALWQSIEKTRAYHKSRQVAQFLTDILHDLGPSVTLGRDPTMIRELLDRAANRVDLDLTNQPMVEAEVRNTIGDVYLQLSELQNAEAMHRAALALYRRLLGNESAEVADSLVRLASAVQKQSKTPEAEDLSREALAIRRRLFGNENAVVAESLVALAGALHWQGKHHDAESLRREALSIRRKLFGNHSVAVANSLNDLSLSLSARSQFVEAEAMLRESIVIKKNLLGDDHPDVAMSLFNLGIVLRKQDRLAEAEFTHRAMLATRRKLLGDKHRDVAISIEELAVLLICQHKLAEAEELTRECLAIREEKLPEDWQTFSVRSLLGSILLEQQRYGEAEPPLLSGYEGVKQRESRIPMLVKESLVAETVRRLVHLYEATGRPNQAVEWKQKLAEFEKAEAKQKAGGLLAR